MRWTQGIIFMCGLLANTLALGGPSAEHLIRIGQLDDAFVVAQAEARERPRDLDAQELLVDLAMTMGLANLVRPRYQEIVSHHPDDADAYYMMGRLALGAHEAEALYRKALELSPGHARSYMGLGAVHRAQGRMGAAEEAYQHALSRDRSLGEAWAGLGAALLAQGRVDDARANARQAVLAVPHEADPYIAVATLEPESAVSILRKGVTAMPDEPRLHTFLAMALLEQGLGSSALVEARAALSLSPGFGSAELAQLVARAQISGTLDGPGYRDMLIAQRLSGPRQRAAFDQLVERYPVCELIWLGRAQVRAAAGDADGSLDDLSRAAQLAPNQPEVQAALGVALERRGRGSLALPWLYKALIARPDDASLAIAAARAEQATGLAVEARMRIA
ncbi:MAG: tetratricopeptide (TPR) repeat protein, partial [Kiritimatiellia bacterium]